MPTLQFSFTCGGIEQMTPHAPLQIINLGHSWKVEKADTSFVVVTGWLAAPGTSIDEHLEIVGEDGQVIGMTTSPKGDRITGKDGRAILVTLMNIDSHAAAAGRYLVQVFSGRELMLEYPIDFQ